MTIFRAWVGIAAALLIGCESEPRPPTPPTFGRAFSHLPLPPNPQVVSRGGSADALQLTIYSPMEITRVTDYYRSALTKGTWRLVSDTRGPDGTTALYAEHDGPPLWVRIWSAKERPGTMVQLMGAVVGQDSTEPQKPSESTRPRSSQPG